MTWQRPCLAPEAATSITEMYTQIMGNKMQETDDKLLFFFKF